jgi:penicillin amidase
VDTTYSYHVGRNHHFPLYRGIIINKLLREAQAVTPADMMALQVNNYDMFADHARKLFTGTIHEQDLSSSEMRYFDILRNWDGYNQVETTGSTVFEVAWKHFYDEVYLDEFKGAPQPVMYPIESSLVDGILRDSAYRFLDNVNTSEVETLAQITLAAFKKAAVELARIDSAGKLPWAKFKGTGVNHLAKLAPFSRLKLPVGGGTHCINATRDTHGPSWRMVIHLNDNTEAYGVYPGGQQGNPGSKYYDSFVDQWAAGKYYPLWLMKRDEAKDKRIKWKMTFQKA